MTRISATPEGMPTEMMARYYARFARGGFGLVITEGIYTDESYSQGYANQPGLSNLAQAKGWRPVVDAVHSAGGKIFAQLVCARRQVCHCKQRIRLSAEVARAAQASYAWRVRAPLV